MAFFKVKVDGKVYELDRLTLGESRILKRDFGLTDLEFFNPTDPDQMVGLMFLAMKKQRPVVEDSVILAEIEGLDIDMFEPEALEPDPTQPPSPEPEPEALAVLEGVSGSSGSEATTQ